jgi:hypothetical protein
MNISLPKTISGWCMWLFFLLYGLTVIPAVGGILPAFLVPLFALAYAIFSFLGM